jgi:hypothetical protein
MRKFLGIALIVMALGIAIIPNLTDCLSQGLTLTLANGSTAPMKCHWTSQAEMALAAPVLAVGAMMFTSKNKSTIRNLSIAGGVLGLAVLAIPTFLIGVCATPTHLCRSVEYPSLLTMGGVITGLGILGMVASQKMKDL